MAGEAERGGSWGGLGDVDGLLLLLFFFCGWCVACRVCFFRCFWFVSNNRINFKIKDSLLSGCFEKIAKSKDAVCRWFLSIELYYNGGVFQ